MKKILCVFLLLVPIIIDVFGYRGFLFYFGLSNVSPESFSRMQTVSPPNFLGIFEVVELFILFCYITIFRSNIFRLILIIFTIVFSTLGMILSSIANIFEKSTIYSVAIPDLISVQKICSISACFYLFSLTFMCMSNVLFRRISFSKMLSLTFILGGAVGVVLTRFNVIPDPRCLQITMINDSLRFSSSELFYLFGLQFALVCYVSEFIKANSDKMFCKQLQILQRQYRIADYYYRRVRTGDIEYVSPMWESMLIGSQLDITKVGRQYYGVPNPNIIKGKMIYYEQCKKWMHVVPQSLGILFIILLSL
ncbi:hypothetical protein [Candidatus Uabimicrobium sp. HlEnr_7]|uniref:hypothetical protein n=1 Tax=Candidatus Uabimicrobium helgolandensis TaxID=3095367 RepID=UPI0035588D78